MTTHPAAEIRLLTAGEAGLYRNIRLEALRRDPDAFTSTFERESAMTPGWFEKRVTSGNIFGAFAAGALAGVAGYWPMEADKITHKAALWGMYVRAEARGMGFGTGLVEAIIAETSGRFEQLLLTVVQGNEAAYGLYLKTGFLEYGREMKALKVDNRYFDEILMVRFLI